MDRTLLATMACLTLTLPSASGCGGDDKGTSTPVVDASTTALDASASRDAAGAAHTSDAGMDAAVAAPSTTADATIAEGDSGTLPLDDSQIAGILAAVNTAEVDLGMMAAGTTSDAAVLAYANMIVAAHTASQDTESTLLQTLALTPEDNDVTALLTSEVLQQITTLNAAPSGDDFDYTYLAGEVKLHQDVLDVIDRSLLKQVQDPDLTAFVESTRAMVASHLAAAKALLADYVVASDGGVSGGPADASL